MLGDLIEWKRLKGTLSYLLTLPSILSGDFAARDRDCTSWVVALTYRQALASTPSYSSVLYIHTILNVLSEDFAARDWAHTNYLWVGQKPVFLTALTYTRTPLVAKSFFYIFCPQEFFVKSV